MRGTSPGYALELPWALLGFFLDLQVESTSPDHISGEMTYPPGWDHLLGCVIWIPGTQGSAQGRTPGDRNNWSRSGGMLRGVRHLAWKDRGLLHLKGSCGIGGQAWLVAQPASAVLEFCPHLTRSFF